MLAKWQSIFTKQHFSRLKYLDKFYNSPTLNALGIFSCPEVQPWHRCACMIFLEQLYEFPFMIRKQELDEKKELFDIFHLVKILARYYLKERVGDKYLHLLTAVDLKANQPEIQQGIRNRNRTHSQN